MALTEILESDLARYTGALLAVGAIYYLVSAGYYVYFHPLAQLQGPFFAKFSGWPSYYHTLKGDRHIWIWQCHQIYGSVFRFRPDGVLFNSPAAHRTIYDAKSNVQKGIFYKAWPKDFRVASNTWSSVDKVKHARKRRILNSAFSDKAMKSAEPFIVQHAERWCELLTEGSGKEWSEARNMADWSDYLVLDILGELCYGRSFDTKESGINELKPIPRLMGEYMMLLNKIANAPFRDLWVWLKPRGLDSLFKRMGPRSVKNWAKFVESCLAQRIEEDKRIQEKGLTTGIREDMFYHILRAKDPETGHVGYSRAELHHESEMLVVAGSDTTSTVFAAMFFYLTRYPIVYGKLVAEIRAAFTDLGQIREGTQLQSCRYLRAFIDEAMRMNPPISGDLIREVMAGGITVDGHYLDEGTSVGVSAYALHHNQEIFTDSAVFRPERWIPDEAAGIDSESVSLSRSGFVPFSIGPRGCVGKNLAYMEMSIVMAKILFLADVRGVDGDDLGGGRPDMIWGRRNKMQFQTKDIFVSAREGPMVQFRTRMV